MARYEINPFTKEMERVDKDGYVSPAITSSSTLTLEQEYIVVDASGGDVTITLPAITSDYLGKYYYIKRIDSSGNVVTITPNGSDTIDGAANQTLDSEDDSLHIVAIPGDWAIYGKVGLDYAKYTKEPTGFLESNDDSYTTISFDNGTKVFTLTKVQNFTVFVQGRRFYYTANETYDLTTLIGANGHGTYFIYFDTDGVIQASATPWTIGGTQAFIAAVYWDNTNAKGFVLDERHGCVMDWATHNYLHHTRGGQYDTGLALTYPTNDGDDGSLSLTAGDIHDEDIEHNISATTTCSTFYRLDATNFTWDASDSSVYKTVSGSIAYDNVGTPTAVPNNRYVCYYVIATNSDTSGNDIISIMGQTFHITLSGAEEEQINDLTIAELPNNEFVVCYKIIYQQTAGGVSRIETFDLRYLASEGIASFTANDHGLLAGLADDDHAGYAWLAGRADGQELYGGVNSGAHLHLYGSTLGDGYIMMGTYETGLRFNEEDENCTIGGGETIHTINGSPMKSLFEFHCDGNTAPANITFHRHSNTAELANGIIMMRSRGDHTTPLIVQDGDVLGSVCAAGFDGTDEAMGARIYFEVDGTPGTDDMPSRIRFLVSPDGSQTPAEAMRISSDKSALFADAVTVQGLFTSVGIDDNADETVITLSTNTMTLGNVALTNYYLRMAVNDQFLRISGGTTAGGGGNIILYGGDHLTAAYDSAFYAGSTLWMYHNTDLVTTTITGELDVYHATANVVATFESGDSYARIGLVDNTTTDFSYVGIGALGNALNLYAGGGIKATIESTGNTTIYGDVTIDESDLSLIKTTSAAIDANFDSNRSGAGAAVARMTGLWDGTQVARIALVTGTDTTNKDDGRIIFYTSPDSVTGLTSSLTLHSDRSAEFFGDVSIAGAFTSLGIEDNASQKTMEVNNASLTLGIATGNNFTITKYENTTGLFLSGSTSSNVGANILLYSEGHVTTGDSRFRCNTDTWMLWNEDVGAFYVYTGTGTKTQALLIDASQNATVAGNFASLGIDDNANETALTLADGSLELGISGLSFGIYRSIDDQWMTFAGGSAVNSGANIICYGGSHTNQGDMIFRNDSVEFFRWDETLGVITIKTGSGATKTLALTIDASQGITVAGNFTSLGIDDNAIGTRLALENTTVNFGTSGATYNICHAVNDQLLRLNGGSSVGNGGNIRLYGSGHTSAGDIDFLSGTNITGKWDDSAYAWYWYAGASYAQNIKLANNLLTVGNAGNFAIVKDVEDDNLMLSGGTAWNSGGGAAFFGTGHGSAGDVILRSSGNNFLLWDESGGDLYLYTGTGSKTLALTLDDSQEATFPGDVNVTGGALRCWNTGASNLITGRYDASNTNGPVMGFIKSRSGTVGTAGGIVLDDDYLGFMRFYGDDGTDTASWGGEIRVRVDGTPGVNDLPAHMELRTTPSGSPTPTTAIFIGKDQSVCIGFTQASTVFEVRYLSAITGGDPAAITITSTRNSSGWTAGADLCALNFDSDDLSGTGAGTRASIKLHTRDAVGANHDLRFYCNDGTTADVESLRVHTKSVTVLGDTTAGGDVATLRIETQGEASTSPGDSYAELLFALNGAENATGELADSAISAIKCIDWRTGSTSYEDAGIGFYTVASGDTAPVFRGGFSNRGGFQVGSTIYEVYKDDVYIEGYVGIGTTPDTNARIHCYSGTGSGATVNAFYDNVIIEGSGTVGLSLMSADANVAAIAWASATTSDLAQIRATYGSGSPYMELKLMGDTYLKFLEDGSANNVVELTDGQLKFPATENPSTDANTLDDYKEGTYTASVTPATSGSYTLSTSADTAAYTKIGNTVFVTGWISVASSSTPSGDVRVSLPYTIDTLTDRADESWQAIALTNGGNTQAGMVFARFEPGNSYFTLCHVDESGSFVNITAADLDSAFQIKFAVFYFV